MTSEKTLRVLRELNLTDEQIEAILLRVRIAREKKAPYRDQDFESYVWQAITFSMERQRAAGLPPNDGDPEGNRSTSVAKRRVSVAPSSVHEDDEAAELIEKLRWGACPVCPKCAHKGAHRVRGGVPRLGRGLLWRCDHCTRQFTVRVGTFLGNSSVPLRHWVFALWAAGQGGITVAALARSTGVTPKTARLMLRRLRAALKAGGADLGSGFRLAIEWEDALRLALRAKVSVDPRG